MSDIKVGDGVEILVEITTTQNLIIRPPATGKVLEVYDDPCGPGTMASVEVELARGVSVEISPYVKQLRKRIRASG